MATIDFQDQENVLVDGKRYASAKTLAGLYDVTGDYLSRLARANRVEAVILARKWYLSVECIERIFRRNAA